MKSALRRLFEEDENDVRVRESNYNEGLEFVEVMLTFLTMGSTISCQN